MQQPPISWHFCDFKNLDNFDLYSLLQLRSDIFVVEQNCVFLDMDDYDQKALHLLGKINNNLACYARLLAPNTKYKEASIGRVVNNKLYRKMGLGYTLMDEAKKLCIAQWPNSNIRIGAQQHLSKFYNNCGFVQAGEPYVEDDIWHIEMLHTLPITT